MSKEIWVDIPEYEGMYQVSNMGKVKSLKRKVNSSYGKLRIIKERILILQKSKDKYIQINLSKNSKTKTHKVHRLVLLVFKGKSDLHVNHIDGNKQNNTLDNLAYCTKMENEKHAWEMGLKNNEHHRIKVKQYDKQGNFIKEYVSMTEAEKQTGVFITSISRCIKNKQKQAGSFKWKYA